MGDVATLVADSLATNYVEVTNQPLAQVKIKTIRAHDDTINCAIFFCDDTRIASCSADRSVRIFDPQDGTELAQYADLHEASISQCCITEDSCKLLSCGWDKQLKLTDMETGMTLWSNEHRGIITSCAFSHDGKKMVSASDLDRTMTVWDANTGQLIHQVSDLHKSTITQCLFDAGDSRVITTSMDKTTRFWDSRSGINTITLSGHDNVVSNACTTASGQTLATCGWDKRICLWDVATGTYRQTGPRKLDRAHDGCISAAEFSRDGSLLISASYDKSVAIWDADECLLKLKLQGHEDWVTDVHISNDGSWLLTASKDKTLRLWNIKESDKIPVVVENTKNIGNKMANCVNCDKPFPVTMLDDSKGPGITVCVFCRLQSRPTIWSIVENVLPTDADLEDEEEEEFAEKRAT